MRIAIVSSYDNCSKISEDILLVTAFNDIGVDADIVAWDDSAIDWGIYDGTVLRSAWDYHTKYDSFIKWLGILDSKNIPLINNTKIIRWNTRKDLQLSTLNDMGLPIIPYIISNYSDINYKTFAKHLNADTLVIKPVVSASGNNTFLLNSSGEKPSVKDQPFIIQPFIENIKNGEYALIFIDGVYSHAVIRFPGILSEKKSSIYVDKADVPEYALSLAMKCSNNIKNYFGQYPAYARYDIVDGYIMEVELAEPDLMTRCIPNEADKKSIMNNLAMAIVKRIGQ